MRLAKEFLPGAGRSLADCCAAFGIEIGGAHRASVDALATAQLLQSYLSLAPEWDGWDAAAAAARTLSPFLVPRAEWVNRDAERDEPRSFLQRITVKLPDYSGPEDEQNYLALLDRCLVDRDISVYEAESLVHLAESRNIGRLTCEKMHHEYFDALVVLAWSDGVLDTTEISDLRLVAEVLNIAAETLAAALIPRDIATAVTAPAQSFALAVGDRIVLTGQMDHPREEWFGELRERGLVPWPAVTKKVTLLVAADINSFSGKAQKARDYNIPIVNPDGLRRLLRNL